MSSGAPADVTPEDVTPGLTSWGSEAIRLFAAELGHPPPSSSPAVPAASPLR